MAMFSPTKKRKADGDFFVTSKIMIDHKVILGKGGFSIIFFGTYENRQVAVKRIQTAYLADNREEDALKKLEHDNIIKLYHAENQSDDQFRCFALEYCATSMDKLFWPDEEGKTYPGPRPNKQDGLFHMADGLAYLHDKKLMHRDIKPHNILVSATAPVVLKWADFGFVKGVNARGTHSFRSGVHCTQEWAAPEILNRITNLQEDFRKRGTIKSDIFSTGMVFFCWLTDGIHPFGDSPPLFCYHIIINNHINFSRLDEVIAPTHPVNSMIKFVMMNPNPDRRTSMKEIKKIVENFKSQPGR